LGVLVANTVASFLVGVVALLPATTSTRLVLAVGFGGGLSTLSTLAVDTVSLWRHGRRGAAVSNLVVTVAAGVAAALMGMWVGRAVGLAG
jgi:CrcB protein